VPQTKTLGLFWAAPIALTKPRVPTRRLSRMTAL